MDITGVRLHAWCGFTDPWLVEECLVSMMIDPAGIGAHLFERYGNILVELGLKNGLALWLGRKLRARKCREPAKNYRIRKQHGQYRL